MRGKQSKEKNPEEPRGRGWDSLAGSVGHPRTQISLITATSRNSPGRVPWNAGSSAIHTGHHMNGATEPSGA